jgi:hypothetical protein
MLTAEMFSFGYKSTMISKHGRVTRQITYISFRALANTRFRGASDLMTIQD